MGVSSKTAHCPAHSHRWWSSWAAISFHPLARTSLLKTGIWETIHLATLQVAILVLDVLANNSSHLHIYHKFLGHYVKIVPFMIKKNTGNHLLPRHSKCKSKSHLSLHILRSKFKALSTCSLFLSALQTLPTQATHVFHFPEPHCGLLERHSVELWCPDRLQITSLIERHNDLLKELLLTFQSSK